MHAFPKIGTPIAFRVFLVGLPSNETTLALETGDFGPDLQVILFCLFGPQVSLVWMHFSPQRLLTKYLQKYQTGGVAQVETRNASIYPL